jgi:hypothetical protein
MNTLKPKTISTTYRLLAWSLSIGLPACLSACAGNSSSQCRPAAIPDLDSLNREVEHNDSVESNYFFYEEAFTAYKAEFPGMDKPTYMSVARGKDQAFCLFHPRPSTTCLDVGNKFKALGLEEPARDAYEAGLLSEGMNGDTLNILLWSGMARLHIGWGHTDRAMPFLTKVLEVDTKNAWAKKTLASLTPAAEGAQKPAPAAKSAPGQSANRRGSKEKARKSAASRGGNYGMTNRPAANREAAI